MLYLVLETYNNYTYVQFDYFKGNVCLLPVSLIYAPLGDIKCYITYIKMGIQHYKCYVQCWRFKFVRTKRMTKFMQMIRLPDRELENRLVVLL